MGILKGCGCQLSHFADDVLVMQGEVALIFVAQLQQSNVLPVPPAQRHREPAAHGGMFVGMFAEHLPTWMRFEFHLRHPPGLVCFAQQRVHAQNIDWLRMKAIGFVFVRQRQTIDRLVLTPATVFGQDHQRLVSANHTSGLMGHLVHGRVQGLVGGDGLRRVSGTLQGQHLILHVFFGFGAY